VKLWLAVPALFLAVIVIVYVPDAGDTVPPALGLAAVVN